MQAMLEQVVSAGIGVCVALVLVAGVPRHWRGEGEEQQTDRRSEMPSVNQVVLAGNLTRDPEVKQVGNGVAVCNLGLAVNEVYTGKDGQRHERTCFVEVDAWDGQAENCGKYLSKGSPVLVQGRLEFDQWDGPNGEKRSRLKVRAHRVQFLGRAPQAQEAGSREQTVVSDEVPF